MTDVSLVRLDSVTLHADPAHRWADVHRFLWAKWDRASDAIHPLPSHLMDAASVGRMLWRVALPPSTRQLLAAALGVGMEEAELWLALVCGLHDLGKAGPAFQGLRPASRVRLERAGLTFAFPGSASGELNRQAPHGTVTARVLPGILEKGFGLERGLAQQLAAVVGGHHGVFPDQFGVHGIPASALGDDGWDALRQGLVEQLRVALGLGRGQPPRSSGLPLPAAAALAGLTTTADWIASMEAYFPYAGEGAGLDAARSHELAQEAIRRLGWRPWRPSATDGHDFRELFGFEPRPVQREIIRLSEQLSGPTLVILEAPTGEGKTEAALYLARALALAREHRGIYFALPTEATSNQMFGRVKRFVEKAAGSGAVLQLVHGHAALSTELQTLLRQSAASLPSHIDDVGEPESTVRAEEWFTYRKRGLLAPLGVGTVDQVLLAALAARHVFVRLFGLTDKVVIVDEVHAYDVYMSELLGRLLEWLAALGCSVILLSATLPLARRRQLVGAYLKGLGMQPKDEITDDRYPLLTLVRQERVETAYLTASTGRRLVLRWIQGTDGLPQELAEALASGGCAAVVCNTVDRAQQLFRALKDSPLGRDGATIGLLHARFPYEERQRREEEVVRQFGPGSLHRPERAVLVATQVVEQSLDADFDLMVSDFAPVDLLVQRAGRLHRHKRPRPETLADPSLWILDPPMRQDGVPALLPGDTAVYDPHVLLRTWLVLRARREFAIPEDLREVIEAVYRDGSDVLDVLVARTEDVGAALKGALAETRLALERTRKEAAQEAKRRRIPPALSRRPLQDITSLALEEDAPELHSAFRALTRLGPPTCLVVCLYGTSTRPSLDPAGKEVVDLQERPDPEMVRRLLRRSVQLSHQGVAPLLLRERPPSGWARDPWLRQARPVVFDVELRARVGSHWIELDPEVGVVITGERSSS